MTVNKVDKAQPAKQMKVIKQNLKHIKVTIEAGTLQEQKASTARLIAEVTAQVKEATFKYSAEYVLEKNQYHFNPYVSLARKAKATLLADLQELQGELNKSATSEKGCEMILNKMLESNLHTVKVQNYIDRWVNTTTISTKQKDLLVK